MFDRDFQFACDSETDNWLIKAGRRTYDIRTFDEAIKKFLADEGYEDSEGSYPRLEFAYLLQRSRPSTVDLNDPTINDPSFAFRFCLRSFMTAVYGRTLYRCALAKLPGHASERLVRSRQRWLRRRLLNRLFGRTTFSTWLACFFAGDLPFGTSERAGLPAGVPAGSRLLSAIRWRLVRSAAVRRHNGS